MATDKCLTSTLLVLNADPQSPNCLLSHLVIALYFVQIVSALEEMPVTTVLDVKDKCSMLM
jgi:hypothetical protein